MICIHKDNMVYLPVPKNASTMYVNLFLGNGWVQDFIDEIDTTDKILFGHVQDPNVRHTKGLAEFFQISLVRELDISEKYYDILLSSVPDIHTYPISIIHRNYYEKAIWIPLDSKINSNVLTTAFLQKNGINLKIPADMRKHKTFSDRFKTMVEQITELKKGNKVYMEFEERMLKADKELHVAALEKVDKNNFI